MTENKDGLAGTWHRCWVAAEEDLCIALAERDALAAKLAAIEVECEACVNDYYLGSMSARILDIIDPDPVEAPQSDENPSGVPHA